MVRQVALDVDDVLARFNAGFCAYWNTRFSPERPVSSADFPTYAFWKHLGISQERAREVVYDFYQTEQCATLSTMPGSTSHVPTLADNYQLTVVTSRPTFMADITMSWLDLRFPGIFIPDQLVLTNQFSTADKPISKADVCIARNIELIVEDAPAYAQNCATHGIHVVLLTRPWNVELSPHPLIHRVNGWDEIPTLIHQLSNPEC